MVTWKLDACTSRNGHWNCRSNPLPWTIWFSPHSVVSANKIPLSNSKSFQRICALEGLRLWRLPYSFSTFIWTPHAAILNISNGNLSSYRLIEPSHGSPSVPWLRYTFSLSCPCISRSLSSVLLPSRAGTRHLSTFSVIFYELWTSQILPFQKHRLSVAWGNKVAATCYSCSPCTICTVSLYSSSKIFSILCCTLPQCQWASSSTQLHRRIINYLLLTRLMKDLDPFRLRDSGVLGFTQVFLSLLCLL